MNSLFSIFRRPDTDSPAATTAAGGTANLDKFFEEVQSIKDELKQLELLHKSLHNSNESSKTLYNASAVNSLRSHSDVSLALKKSNLIKLRLDSLDRATAVVCGPGTAVNRARTSVVAALRKKLKSQMENYQELRERIRSEYTGTATGEKVDEETIETLMATGEGEMAVVEIEERGMAAAEIERGLIELQQLFMDMAVVVAAQGEEVDDIESQMKKARSYVERGAEELVTARKYHMNSREWTCCYSMIVLLLMMIILIIMLLFVLNNMKENDNQISDRW